MNSLRCILVIGVFRLIVVVMLAVPKQVFSFSAYPHAVSRPLPLDSRSIKSAGRKKYILQSSASSFSTSTSNSAEVVNNVANIHSLNSITSNPHLFPITSDYIHTLSRLQYGDRSGIRGPSAEEFLNNLSRELLLLSQIEEAQTLEHATPSNQSDPFTAVSRDSHRTSYHAMEVAGPSFTSAFGVGVAAQTYDPALYSQYMNPMMVASVDGGGNSYWDGDSDLYGQPAITAANSAAMDNRDVVDTFVSWQKTQGGSNVLRDLALSIPVDDEIHQKSQQQLDFSLVESMREMDYMISEQGNDASTMASYNHLGGLDDPRLHIAKNEQLGVFTNDLNEDNFAWNSIGDGQEYYYHDITPVSSDSASNFATMDGTVRSFNDIPHQASHLSQVNHDLSSSLSSELSDLKYDDLSSASPNFHHTRGLLSGDIITSKLEQLGLPRYHIELPVITNPFSEISPSLQNAVTSIKQASEASMGKVDGYLNTITHSLDGLTSNVVDASKSVGSLSGQMMNNVADIGTSGFNAIGNAFQSGASNMATIHPPSNVHLPMSNMNINAATSAVMNRVGEASLSDFGNVVISTIKFTCGIVINIFGLFINAMSGTKIASGLADAQSAIFSLIDNASHIVISTMRDIGNMTVIEIIQHLMTLIIAITDILLKILNAIIYLASGHDGASWAVISTSSIKDSSSQLLAQATSTYNDVTHASLSELAHSIGDYGQVVGNEFITLMGSLGNANVPISEDMFGNVASILQTGLSL